VITYINPLVAVLVGVGVLRESEPSLLWDFC